MSASLAPAWLSTAALISAILGPLSHYAIWVRFEFDGTIHYFVPFVGVFEILAIPFLQYYVGTSFVQSLYVSWLLQTCYMTALFTSISLYRLFFHSTRIYPGPFWARLWSWWKVYAFFKQNEQGYIVIDNLHKKYGDVVRIGPRQISINNVEAIAPIYSNNSKCIRSPHAEMGKQKDLQKLRDPEEHKARRKLWDQGLNAKACQDYFPRMNKIIDIFINQLAKFNGEPFVINNYARFATVDVMGETAFGRHYDQLETGVRHEAFDAIAELLQYGITAVQVVWLINILQYMGMPNPWDKFKKFSEMVLKERETNEPENADMMTFIMRSTEDKTAKFPVDRKTLVEDVLVLQIAGSDTSYSIIVLLLYYLARDREMQQRVRNEVLPTLDEKGIPVWNKLATLPLLEAVINETLRMHPAVAQGLTRDTPLTEPMQIGPYLVPAETMVSVPTWTIQHDERYWEKPDEWIPERWTTQPELIKDRRAFNAFSYGRTMCAGKYFAMMEMKMTFARLLYNFDLQLAPGETGKQLLTSHKDHFTTWLPDLRMCLVPREKR